MNRHFNIAHRVKHLTILLEHVYRLLAMVKYVRQLIERFVSIIGVIRGQVYYTRMKVYDLITHSCVFCLIAHAHSVHRVLVCTRGTRKQSRFQYNQLIA